MKDLKQFLAIEAVAIAALFIVASAIAAYGAIDSAVRVTSIIGPLSSAKIGFGYTAIIGLPIVVLIGGPIYFYELVYKGRANWRNVLALGIAPGAVMCVFSITFGMFCVVCGAAISAITHGVCRKLALTSHSRGKPPQWAQ